jgi:hypothetical protein
MRPNVLRTIHICNVGQPEENWEITW